jgi:hypothetical protein
MLAITRNVARTTTTDPRVPTMVPQTTWTFSQVSALNQASVSQWGMP